MITIYFDEHKINKQVLRPGEKFFTDKKGYPRNGMDLYEDARAIAHDVSGGIYHSVTIELN